MTLIPFTCRQRNFGLGDELGTLFVGKRADIVVRTVEDITHTALE
ncbi:hypothetical protein ACWGS9_28660 [Bradyrhizobium sp. Arg314]